MEKDDLAELFVLSLICEVDFSTQRAINIVYTVEGILPLNNHVQANPDKNLNYKINLVKVKSKVCNTRNLKS